MKKTFLISSTALLAFSAAQAAIIFEEDFETDGQGVRYTATTPFNDGSSDHWNRTDGSDINNVTGAYASASGSFFWAAEDTDDDGGNGNVEQTLTITGIDISSYTNIRISLLAAAGNENGAGSSAYDLADSFQFNYDLDSGGESNGVWFSYQDNGDNFNEPIGLDTDFDGFQDGTMLDNTFTEFSTSVADGSNLDLTVRVSMASASEEIAFDRVRVEGDLIPEPSSSLLIGLAGFGLLIRRRK